MFKVNKVYAAIVQTQNGSHLFSYAVLRKKKKGGGGIKEKPDKQTNKQPHHHCLFVLFYYKLTKVLYNPILYKLVS